MEFRHFWEDGRRGDHFHARPQFPRPSLFPYSGEHGKEVISSSFRRFREREHNHPHGHGQGQWEWEFPNREEHKHGRHERHEYLHGSEMKFRRFWGDGPRGDHFRFRPQFPRPSSFPSSESHEKEGISSLRKSIPEEVRPRASLSSSFGSFQGEVRPRAENEKFGFQPRERAFERTVGRPDFPDHGQLLFPDSVEHKHEWHERREDPPAPWTDWLKSLFPGH